MELNTFSGEIITQIRSFQLTLLKKLKCGQAWRLTFIIPSTIWEAKTRRVHF
jgi:hypothetical protein